MASRKSLPKRLEKEIYQQFESCCPFCAEQDVSTLQVHHIEPHAAVQTHEAGNLLLTCANCHQKIEDGRISRNEVYRAKFRAESGRPEKSPSSKNLREGSINFTGTNHGMVANNISVVSPRKSIRINPPTGSIASDLHMRNYIKHLIDRYNDFKAAEMGKERMNYAVVHAGIKRRFGAKWDLLSTEKFEVLVEYLQERIDGTILGKNHRSKGQKRYSSFQEHMQKQ